MKSPYVVVHHGVEIGCDEPREVVALASAIVAARGTPRASLTERQLSMLVSAGAWLVTPLIVDVATCPCGRVRSTRNLCPACGRPGWCER